MEVTRTRYGVQCVGDRVVIRNTPRGFEFCCGERGVVRRIVQRKGGKGHVFFHIEPLAEAVRKRVMQLRDDGAPTVECRPTGLSDDAPVHVAAPLAACYGVRVGDTVKVSCLPRELSECENKVGVVAGIAWLEDNSVHFGVKLFDATFAELVHARQRRLVAGHAVGWLNCQRHELQRYDYERAEILEEETLPF